MHRLPSTPRETADWLLAGHFDLIPPTHLEALARAYLALLERADREQARLNPPPDQGTA